MSWLLDRNRQKDIGNPDSFIFISHKLYLNRVCVWTILYNISWANILHRLLIIIEFSKDIFFIWSWYSLSRLLFFLPYYFLIVTVTCSSLIPSWNLAYISNRGHMSNSYVFRILLLSYSHAPNLSKNYFHKPLRKSHMVLKIVQ